ncbi:MAG: hypothetical protein IH845_04770 [Nanoarchaeota archaeon]|nr:hypothetical protein [Nanoarchaeota archaeon]
MVIKRWFVFLFVGLFLMSFVFAGDVIFKDGNIDIEEDNITNIDFINMTNLETTNLNVTNAFTFYNGGTDSVQFDNDNSGGVTKWTRAKNGPAGVNMLFQKSRGTPSARLYINDGDTISSYNMKAWDESGGDWTATKAFLRFQADGQHDASNFGTKIKFGVGTGTSNAVDAMVIRKDKTTEFYGDIKHLGDNLKSFFGASNDISFEFNGNDFIENVEAGIVSKFITGYVKSIFDHDVEIQGSLTVTETINGTIDMFPFMVHQSTAYLTNLTNTTEIVNCGTPIINSNNYNSSTTQITISESGIYGIDYTLGVLLDSGFGGPRTRINTSMQYSNGTELIGSKAYTMYDDFWEGTGIQNSFIFNNSGEQTISLLISAALGTQGIDATIDDCQISIVRYGKQ